MSTTVHHRVTEVELAQMIAILGKSGHRLNSRSALVRTFVASILASLTTIGKAPSVTETEAREIVREYFHEGKAHVDDNLLSEIEADAIRPTKAALAKDEIKKAAEEAMALGVGTSQVIFRSQNERQRETTQRPTGTPPWLRDGVKSIDEILALSEVDTRVMKALANEDFELLYSIAIVYSLGDELPQEEEKIDALIEATRPQVRRWL